MTPFYYLSPGGGPSSRSFPPEDDQQQLQLFLSPPSSSLITARDPRASLLLGEPEKHDQYPQGLLCYGNSSRDHHHHHHHPRSSSSFQTFVNGPTNNSHKLLSNETLEDNKEHWGGSCEGDISSRKRMSSKMRPMQKTMSSSGSSSTTTNEKNMKLTLKIQDQRYHVNEISTSSFSNYNSRKSNTTPVIRVCSDCNTTTTPLWRSGPCGPKSLCNACGIRQRKARRAAEDGNVTTVEGSSSSRANYKLLAHKEKKPRNLGKSKKYCNKIPEKKLCLKKIALSLSNNSAFRGVFSRDVEEAAILLMELSCGFVPS